MIFHYTWETPGPEPQRGICTIDGSDRIRALILARRTVRDRKFPGLSLDKITMTERSSAEDVTE